MSGKNLWSNDVAKSLEPASTGPSTFYSGTSEDNLSNSQYVRATASMEPTQTVPTFQFGRLVLQTQLTQDQSETQQRQEYRRSHREDNLSLPPLSFRANATGHSAARQALFHFHVGNHTLGKSCGAYLISALNQLPSVRQSEVLSSLQAWAHHSADAKEASNVKARLVHTLGNLVEYKPLTPTYAPFHVQDPAWAIFRSLSFPARAIIEYYLAPEMLVLAKAFSLLRDIQRCRNLQHVEMIVVHFLNQRESEGIADAYAAGGVVDWNVRLTLDAEAGAGFQVKHLGPVEFRGVSTFMHRALGSDRFMCVHLSNRRQWWNERGARALRLLAEEGLHFACRRYKYINHKADSKGVCYFAAEDSLGRERDGFEAMPTHAMVARLGNFFNFPCVPRLVARVALGFSRSYALQLEPRQIKLIDDLMDPQGTASLTDGSGFIAPDLVARLPAHLYQGRTLTTPLHVGPCAVIQVRVICHLGGFKGTLLVNPNLHNRIELRRSSMLKFPPPALSIPSLTRRPSLEAMTTFHVLKASTRLSRELLLIFLALNVPEKVLMQLVDEEVSVLQTMCSNPAMASAFLRNMGATRIEGSPEWQVAKMLDAGHGVDEAYIQRVLKGLRIRALTKLIRGRLLCPSSLYVVGQPDPLGVLGPDEVFLCHGLPAKHVGLPAQGTENGVYEGRVLLARHPIYNPAHAQAFRAVRHPALQSFLGARAGVLFFSTQGTRSQAGRLSDGDMDGDTYFVCMHEKIVEFACPIEDNGAPEKDTNICTKERHGKSKSDNEIFLSNQPDIPASKTIPPCPGAELLTQIGPFRLDPETVGHKIDAKVMRRCLESCVAQAKASQILASASDWWIRHADIRGALSRDCRILGEIAVGAVNSAKTGELWSLPRVLRPQHYPPYLNRYSAVDATSPSRPISADSFLGRVYSRVLPLFLETSRQKSASLRSDDVGNTVAPLDPIKLDVDLRIEGSAAFFELAQSWLKAYRQSLARRARRSSRSTWRHHEKEQQRSQCDHNCQYQASKADILFPFQKLLGAVAAARADKTNLTFTHAVIDRRGQARARQPLQALAANVRSDDSSKIASQVPAARSRNDSITDIQNENCTLETRRLAMASAIYEVTYMGGSILNFVWDLVMPELNQLKKDALARRKDDTIFAKEADS